jgi:hypothetical protein
VRAGDDNYGDSSSDIRSARAYSELHAARHADAAAGWRDAAAVHAGCHADAAAGWHDAAAVPAGCHAADTSSSRSSS